MFDQWQLHQIIFSLLLIWVTLALVVMWVIIIITCVHSLKPDLSLFATCPLSHWSDLGFLCFICLCIRIMIMLYTIIFTRPLLILLCLPLSWGFLSSDKTIHGVVTNPYIYGHRTFSCLAEVWRWFSVYTKPTKYGGLWYDSSSLRLNGGVDHTL